MVAMALAPPFVAVLVKYGHIGDVSHCNVKHLTLLQSDSGGLLSTLMTAGVFHEAAGSALAFESLAA